MSFLPKISVIMPVYNVERYVAEAIESILNQTFTSFELIIVNDGSIDNTTSIVTQYLDKDSRIIFLDNKDNKQKPTRLNDGIAIAQGKYFTIMDGDDISLPDRLQKQYDYMESHLDVMACGSQIQRFGNKNARVEWPETYENIYLGLLSGCCFNFPLIQRAEYDKHSLYFEPDFLAEDYLMWIKMADVGKIVALSDVLYLYRTHPTQMSSANVHNINKYVRLEKNIHINNLNKKLMNRNIDEFEFWLDKPLIYCDIIDRTFFLSNIIKLNNEKKIFTAELFNYYIAKIWYRQFYLMEHITGNAVHFFLSKKKMRTLAKIKIKN
jgi:glycosyltransferase involved in cell wall biosynthesis